MLQKFIMFKCSLVISIYSYQIPHEQNVEGRKPSLWLDVFLAQGLLIKKRKHNAFSARMKEKIPLLFDWHGVP